MKTVRLAAVLLALLCVAGPAQADPFIDVLSESFRLHTEVFDIDSYRAGLPYVVGTFDLTSSVSLPMNEYFMGDLALFRASAEAAVGSDSVQISDFLYLDLPDSPECCTPYFLQHQYSQTTIVFHPVDTSPLVFNGFADHADFRLIDQTTGETIFNAGMEGWWRTWTVWVDPSHTYALTSRTWSYKSGFGQMNITVPEPSEFLLLAAGLGAVALAAFWRKRRLNFCRLAPGRN